MEGEGFNPYYKRPSIGPKEYPIVVQNLNHEYLRMVCKKQGINIDDIDRHLDNFEPKNCKAYTELSMWYGSLVHTCSELNKIKAKGMNTSSLTLRVIFPYGQEEKAPFRVRIPVKYESLSEDKGLLYNMMMVASNRNFWFLLTLEEKHDLYDFLNNNINTKLDHVARSPYTFGDLIEDLMNVLNQDKVFTIARITNDETYFKTHRGDFYEPEDMIMGSSLEPYRSVVWRNIGEKFIVFEKIPPSFPPAQLGQYINNVLQPKGSVGY